MALALVWMTLTFAAEPEAVLTSYHRFQLDDQSRPLQAVIWFPQSAVNQTQSESGKALPLVVFSHGLSGDKEQSRFLCKALASLGMIVAAVDHPNNTGHDFIPTKVFESGINRPKEISGLITHLLKFSEKPGSYLYRKIDPARIGAMGHSFGGYTVLMLSGAKVNTKNLPINQKVAEQGIYQAADPRIKATVALAPFYRPAFDEQSFAQVTTPIFLLAGTRDNITPLEHNQASIFSKLTTRRCLLTVAGATHFNFIDQDIIDHNPLIRNFQHFPTIKRDVSDQLMVRAVTEFFKLMLLDQKPADFPGNFELKLKADFEKLQSPTKKVFEFKSAS